MITVVVRTRSVGGDKIMANVSAKKKHKSLCTRRLYRFAYSWYGHEFIFLKLELNIFQEITYRERGYSLYLNC